MIRWYHSHPVWEAYDSEGVYVGFVHEVEPITAEPSPHRHPIESQRHMMKSKTQKDWIE